MAMSMSVKWTRNSQSVTNNTTTATLTVTITSTNSYNYNGMPATVKVTGDASYSGSFSWTIGSYSTKQVFSRQFTINHDDDGTAKATATVTCRTQVSAGTLTKTVSITPPAIARASTITVPSKGTLGEVITCDIDRHSTSFTHRLRYSFGSLSGTITSSANVSWTWTPTVATFAPEIPNKTSGTMIIYCDTYKGSTKIGTKSDTISLSVPSSVVPTISSLSASDANGYLGTYGAYVQGKSSINASVSAAGAHGSTIKSYSIKMDSLGYSGASSSTTLGTPSNTGTRTITATVTDSRGRTATTTTTISVAAYSPPVLNGSWIKRWDTASGHEDDDATTVRMHAQGSVTNINNRGVNKATVKLAYKTSSATNYTTISTGTYTTSFNFDKDQTGISNEAAYDFMITVTDSLGSSSSMSYRVETTKPVMDFLYDGTGMAIGGLSSKSDTLEVFHNLQLYHGRTGISGAYYGSAKYIEIFRTTVDSEDSGLGGSVRFYGTVGGYQEYNSAYFDFVLYPRQGSSSAAIHLLQKSSDAMSGVMDVVATYDSSRIWHVYLYFPANQYAKYNVYADTGQLGSSPYQNYEIPIADTTAVTGSQVFSLNSCGTWVELSPSNGRAVIKNHTALGNGVWLQGQLNNGNATNILGINSSNQIEMLWSSGGLRGRVLKQLWSGSWSAGGGTSSRITVPETEYYNMFLLHFSSRDARILAIRNISRGGGAIIGTQAFTTGNNNSFTRYAVTISIDGNVWSNFRSVYAYDDSAAVSQATVLDRVEGVL